VIGVHQRTISDWKRGKYNFSESVFDALLALVSINKCELKYEEINVAKQRSRAGSIGAKARFEKYGQIGTVEGRKKGGRASYEARRNLDGDMFNRKSIRKPNESVKLSEFIGICMGDGSITDYRLAISLNNEDDVEYIEFVVELGKNLFGIEASVHKLKYARCSVVVFNGIELINYLTGKGLPKGDKIRAGLDIPEWVYCDQSYVKSCIRGLFDTDGSIFLETHHIKNKKYSYPRMAFVSASEALREQVCDGLIGLGIAAKIRGNRNVTIERFTDVEKYFKIVGSSNQKHLDRYAQFGEVA